MSDRAANEKKVTRPIKEKKEDLNIRGDSQYENEVHSFTCAAHKINNMALAKVLNFFTLQKTMAVE